MGMSGGIKGLEDTRLCTRIRKTLAKLTPAGLLSFAFGKKFSCMGAAAKSLPENMILPDEDKQSKEGNRVDLRL